MTSVSIESDKPPLSHILETCIYVRDLEASTKFYQDTLGISPFAESPRLSGFALGTTTLLLFQLGATANSIQDRSGIVPGHGPTPYILSQLLSTEDQEISGRLARLKQHFCFAVPNTEDVAKWDKHLQNQGVRILGRMDWELGGKSVYFEDPDGHVGEIGSRGIWAHYDIEK